MHSPMDHPQLWTVALLFFQLVLAACAADAPISYRWAYRSPYSVLDPSAADTGKGSRSGAVNSNSSVITAGTPDLMYAHGGMLERLPNGSLAAIWQGSPDFWEGSRRQGIYWAVSNDAGHSWTTARELAGPQGGLPVWAPLLFADGKNLHMFFSGPTPQLCSFQTGEAGSGTHWSPGGSLQMMTSSDGGATWGTPRVIYPYSYEGGVAKMTANRMVVTRAGTWLLPFWREASSNCQSPRWHGQPGVMISRDKGATWMLAQPLPTEDTEKHGWLIEGSLVAFNKSDGREGLLQMFRTTNGVIADSMSVNDGVTWSRVHDTAVPNPNAKVSNAALPDGSLLLAYNDSPSGRSPLAIGRSRDGGLTWQRVAVIEDDPSASFHYPGIFYLPDAGKVLVAYTVSYPPVALNGSQIIGARPNPALATLPLPALLRPGALGLPSSNGHQVTNYGKVTYGIRVASLDAKDLMK